MIIKFRFRQNLSRNESEIFKYVPEIEFLVTSCMLSKSSEIRTETYSTILGLVTVIVFHLKSRHHKIT